jgi:hypothetical protein
LKKVNSAYFNFNYYDRYMSKGSSPTDIERGSTATMGVGRSEMIQSENHRSARPINTEEGG